MKNVVFALLLTASGAFAQDLKEASSEKPSILEARLRDAKPAVETKLSDGASARIWIETANENRQARLAKALVKSEKSTKNEGSLTVKATFLYENGQLLGRGQ